MQRRTIFASLGLGLLANLGMVGGMMPGLAQAQTAYQNAVLADNPVLYYQFNEDPGATQVLDSSGTLNVDGSSRNSQFVGTRSSRFATDEGFTLTPGQGVIFGGLGPVGRAVEFNDPDAFMSDAGDPDPRGELPGGYIETGLRMNFGPDGVVNDGNTNEGTDWSIEFLHRDYRLQAGDNNTEQIVHRWRQWHQFSRQFRRRSQYLHR